MDISALLMYSTRSVFVEVLTQISYHSATVYRMMDVLTYDELYLLYCFQILCELSSTI